VELVLGRRLQVTIEVVPSDDCIQHLSALYFVEEIGVGELSVIADGFAPFNHAPEKDNAKEHKKPEADDSDKRKRQRLCG
jgi:hypothetical protein